MKPANLFHKTKLIHLGLAVLLLWHPVLAKNTSPDHQLWMDLTLRRDLKELGDRKQIFWGGDAGFRGFSSNQNWNQCYLRPTLSYRSGKIFSYSGAMASFFTLQGDTATNFEFRFHQDIEARFPETEVISFFYRLRLEERFFNYSGGESDQSMRVRFLIGAESPDIHLGKGQRPFYLQLFYEIFQNGLGRASDEVFINKARPTFVFAHRVSPSFQYEFNFIGQRSRLVEEKGKQETQFIYRIRVFYRVFKTDQK